MSLNSPGAGDNLRVRLTGYIESLYESFHKLSKTATFKDLIDQLVPVLRKIFPNFTIDIAFRQGDSHAWEKILESGSRVLEMYITHSEKRAYQFCETHETPGGIVIVQKLGDTSLIGLAISGGRPGSVFSEIDVLNLRLLLHLFDNAYQAMVYRRNEKGLGFSLNHRLLQLNSLIDTGIEVANLDSKSSPHRLALERAASLTNASKGFVRVSYGKDILEEHTFPEKIVIPPSAKEGNVIRTRFTFSANSYTFELIEKESRAGIIPFDDTDQLLLDALARQVHASLENRYLHQQALEKQRIEQELNVAASIQKKIIPVSLPTIQGYDIAGKNIPSKSVGGDYYDCIPLADGRYALIIADVTGKGVPAALLVSSLHAYLSAYLEVSSSLSELVGKLNTALYNASTDDKFVTAFIAILSPQSGELEYSNAGHTPGYIARIDDTIQELKVGGFPLGAFDLGRPYKSEKIIIGKGERLFLYTDGVTEATNALDEFYEHKYQLSEFLVANNPARAEAFVAGIITHVKQFTGSAPQNDDITALFVGRMP